jgi:hypothetical protein
MLEELEAKLAKYEEAYDNILLGDSEAMVAHGGNTVTYRKADLGRIEGRITSLQAQIRAKGGSAGTARRAINVTSTW